MIKGNKPKTREEGLRPNTLTLPYRRLLDSTLKTREEELRQNALISTL